MCGAKHAKTWTIFAQRHSMCQALFHIRVPTLSSSLIPGGPSNQKGQTTTIADCISIVTATSSVFDMRQKHLGFGTTTCNGNTSIPVCGNRVLASKVRRPSVWLSENVPNRSGYGSLGGAMEAAVLVLCFFISFVSPCHLQPWGISDWKLANVKKYGKSRDYDSWALKRYETMSREARAPFLILVMIKLSGWSRLPLRWLSRNQDIQMHSSKT